MASIPTDWGLPDWRDSSAYGNVSEWSELRWRWEFTRRREDVRTTFLQYADETHKSLMASPRYAEMRPEDGKTPDDPSFWAMTPIEPMFGMIGIPNPRISEQPLLDHLFTKSHGVVHIGHGKDYLDFEEWTSVFLPKGAVAIEFDINRPLAPQIKSAEVTLAGLAKLKQRRRHRSKWLTYLRALDGKEAGASWSVIASVLLGRAQREQLHAPQSASEIWDQAHSLMFNWPD
ncbi:hypothetical protein [Mesorhizobium sp.]|uniref:hypothetical protein n=1 Tax=Mesorhizobium sp. TaxID=1871066 RepID=UPI000FE612EA|nr:hypothetical protein [Mesorhizobium sp.]RWN27581.1 MAG: hypothetical protein EOR95_24280 [Mesorhizobium sp.]